MQAGSPGGDEGESRDDWELFWTGGGHGLGFDGFFAGFSSTLAAVVAGVAYAAGSMAVALATLALLPSGSFVLWPSTRVSAVLGTLFGGFVGAIGILLAGLLVAAYALWRRGSASHGGSSPLGH